ncbi:MAG TPA: hypothetical protein VLB46_03760 [Pyrinomonadaceae bacterium]|nr:hypothetical protein [Pyrinomonadaceae bacterium]
MHRRTAIFTLVALIAVIAIKANAQQPASEEFMSILGRFGIMLPANYAEHKAHLDLTLGEEKLSGALFRWVLDSDQAIISYLAGSVDFEAKADVYLKAFRDNYAQKTTQGTIIGEKSTSLAGHPGLIFVIENPNGRTMAWVYLLKNRIYVMSLTLNDGAKMEEHVKLMSTFRFLSSKDLEPRLAKLVAELTPEPLPLEASTARPTTDAQDVALKGPVKTVITEQEHYLSEALVTNRDLVSVEDFDEKGNLTRSVLYAGTLPEAVRLYGILKGERVFREMRKFPDVVLATKKPEQKESVEKAPKPEARDFKMKYKYDKSGQLLERRVMRPDGKELESFVYDPKNKSVEHTFDPAYWFMAGTFDAADTKITSTLDANGHAMEDTIRVPEGVNYVSRSAGPGRPVTTYEQRYKTQKIKYEYELDQRGNWIKRTTFKDKQAASVTYRTITYYQ